MKVNGTVLAAVVPIAMVAGVALGMATGWWQTESSKTPMLIQEGAFAGEPNPADIRGSYSLEDIGTAFEVPVEVLAAAFLVDTEPNPGAIQVKEFEERFGVLPGAPAVDATGAPAEAGVLGDREIGTDAMRLFVAAYRGLPYEPEADTGILPTALAVIESAGTASPEELAALRDRLVVLPTDAAAEPGGDTGAPAGTAHAADAAADPAAALPEDDDEFLVKGNTTFGELLVWGVGEDAIRRVTGGEIGARGTTVRTWAIEENREFSTIKEALQELVDNAVQ